MEKETKTIKQHKNPPSISGVFRGASRGYGFVEPDDEYKNQYPNDIFIPADKTMGAMNGDKTELCVFQSDKGFEGYIIAITERAVKETVGTLYAMRPRGRSRRRMMYVKSDDDRIPGSIYVEPGNGISVKTEDKVRVLIKSYPTDKSPAQGIIIENYGNAWTKDANYNSILASYGIESSFPPETVAEAKIRSSEQVTVGSRLELREKIIFTIDGEDAKDLDDAISPEITESGYILGVHIADVSHYVASHSALDSSAFERGTSVYFADQVVPMLPTELSNGACSLNQSIDRYALSALIELDKNGDIENCTLAETVINSKVRGVYSEINDIFEKNEKSEFFAKYVSVYQTLTEMHKLYEILLAKAKKRGMLELETTESKIIVNDEGYPVDIVKRVRGDGERLIEQFMLCANEAVANYLFYRDMPCVYRIHEPPSPEKLKAFSLFANNLDLPVNTLAAKTIYPAAFSPVMKAAKEKGIDAVVSLMLLRTQTKAYYGTSGGSHFGLGIDKYCHFTSPIRRYPDLYTHRIIKSVLNGEAYIGAVDSLASGAVAAAERSSENEIRAMNAERDIEDLYKCMYMFDRIGSRFDGIISSVTSFGLFVQLPDTCEGLIPKMSLDPDARFDAETFTLSAAGEKYTLGMRVRVMIEDVNIITRRINMSLVGSGKYKSK